MTGDDDVKGALMAKWKKVQDILSAKMYRSTNQYEIIDMVWDSYIVGKHASSRKGSNLNKMFTPFREARHEEEDVLFVQDQSAATKLTESVQNHWHIFSESPKQEKIVIKGHVVMIIIGCKSNWHI